MVSLARPAPRTSLKAKPLFLPLSLPIPPSFHQTPGELCCRRPGACRSPGLVLEGREQCGAPGPSRLGSEHVALLHLLCRMYIQASVSLTCLRQRRPLHDIVFSVAEPTGFTYCPVPAASLTSPPKKICIFLLKASFFLWSRPGPKTVMWLKPSGLKISEIVAYPSTPKYTTYFSQTKTGSWCFCLLYQRCSVIQKKKKEQGSRMFEHPVVLAMESALASLYGRVDGGMDTSIRRSPCAHTWEGP